jgi:FixJ family two-component response regulator
MGLVASGLLNKQVGWELGISEITVKTHRGKMMQKMKADSRAALVTMAAKLHVSPIWNESPGAHAQAVALRG